MKRYSLLILLFSSWLNAEIGCSIASLVTDSKSTLFEKEKEANCSDEVDEVVNTVTPTTGITAQLKSLKLVHDNKEIRIERKILKDGHLCPPFCIEPMHIQGVTTLGELEVLAFIDKLKEKKARLFIDVRESKDYLAETIAGAINLPLSMLDDKSQYFEEVLKLLGAKKDLKNPKKKWQFKEVQTLLVFGTSATSNEASTMLKKLLALGYPKEKLFYYRAGIEGWKSLGLSTYFSK